ncbi:MAG: sodium:calcium antiporter [Planctomycetaceae bacterium]
MLELSHHSLSSNLLIFAVSACGVWLCGTKLSRYVDLIADRTGIGKVFAGALLLGGATSLPELATTVTASLSGAAELAGTNLLGGVVMQVGVLALVDAFCLRDRPLTLFSPAAVLLMQGVFLIFMVAVALAAVVSGEIFTVAGIGFWPVLLALTYVFGLWVLYRYEGDPRWEPAGDVEQPPESARDLKDAHHADFADTSTTNVVGRFAIAAVGVLVSGSIVAQAGEVIAEQSGIGQSFVGATLVALATSLPEVSTTFSAVRFGAYSMAAANILGTNALEIALFLPADVAYREGAVINSLNPSAAFLGALGIIVTSVYLWGILERRNRTVLGMGQDSAAVLVFYLAGMVLFYFL